VDDSTTVEWLSKAIGQATKAAKFCIAGSLPVVDPGIEVEGVGTIPLPLKRKTAKELVAACQVAPYGKGTQTLVNKKVRNTFELDPRKFRLSDAWNSAIAHATRPVAEQLGLPAEQLEARLYKLLVYEKGGFFLPHRDSEKHDRMVASLIVGVLIAVPSGIVAAMRKDSAWDYGSMGFAIFVYSMPGFWKGIILIWIFSVYLGWFPAVGFVAPWQDFWNSMWRLVLPAITLGTFFSGLVARNRRRYGGYVVHAAIVVLLIGAVGIGGFSTSQEERLAPGESITVGDYRLVYTGSEERRGANAQEVRAQLDVYRGDGQVGAMEAGKNRYFAEEQTSNEVGIRTDWLRGEDLFVIADQFNEDGSVVLKVIVNPLVNFIWLSGLIFVLGSVVAMWPDAREQRRLAARFASEGAAVARA